MKHIQLFEEFIKNYGEKMDQTAFEELPVGAKVLYKGTQFEVEKNNGATIVIRPVKGGSPTMVNLNQFNQGGAIVESFESFAEESLNEDSTTLLTSLMLLMQSTAVLAVTMARTGALDGLDDASLTGWWSKWRRDRKVNKILDKLKDDPEILQFLELPNSQQRGNWQKLIMTKLTGDEQKYLTSISRDRVKKGKV